ncbi:domain of Kin17 curved DNA-binding protein-domain-containing protein [Neurospora tetraspora]|uniref:Domain of Kin17 curved DNA-binding protein-domain-containing protein n=1 Tax=Neurospora tetraspora TaxID=94610 RepID=A0AAE0JL62_9PEZI|nr:domain of Kin17 curved DNA-binding protein-domain-containing protein [Neurospora tetraspora]
MPKAEVGSAKYLANKMKSRGLNRLRWYCQLCEKSCRDENGYKMHCQSPSHTAKALEAGTNFKGVQDTFSDQFLKDFVSQLKTSHGEKEIHINKFYQEVIARKDHVHLNATKWHSLTEFAKYLGREGVCRVEEKEGEGLFVAWIDDSPEAMERREKVRRKEMMDKGDEEREMKVLREQIRRAQKEAEARGVKFDAEAAEEEERKELKRREGEKIKLSFGKPAVAKKEESGSEPAKVDASTKGEEAAKTTAEENKPATDSNSAPAAAAAAPKPVSMKFGMKPQPKNVFKNAFAGAPKKVMAAPPKKMSEAERIMKEELERKRAREEKGGNLPNKKPRFQF